MSDDEYFENTYEGALVLRPFLRAWARARWAKLSSFVRYRVLRRPRPPRPTGRLSFIDFESALEEHYSPSALEAWAAELNPAIAMFGFDRKKP